MVICNRKFCCCTSTSWTGNYFDFPMLVTWRSLLTSRAWALAGGDAAGQGAGLLVTSDCGLRACWSCYQHWKQRVVMVPILRHWWWWRQKLASWQLSDFRIIMVTRDGNSRLFLLQSEAHIQVGHEQFVHHMVVYLCEGLPEVYHNMSADCLDHGFLSTVCDVVLAAWAVGSEVCLSLIHIARITLKFNGGLTEFGLISLLK